MGKLREQETECMQGDGFAQQMRVRRKVKREIILEMTAVPVELLKKFLAKSGGKTIADQMINPDPRQSPERHFESAGPVDSPLERIGAKPAL